MKIFFKTDLRITNSVCNHLGVFIALFLTACVGAPIQNELESFNRQSDYDYFVPLLQDAELYPVLLNNTGFFWPALSQAADTVMLEFVVSATQGINPAIEISYGSASFLQYFEEGGAGKRYLDLTPLLQTGISAGDFVKMAAIGASWSSLKGTLATFDNNIDLSSKTLVIAPHPDDAEIAAFGFYQATQADVVTITAGDAGGSNFEYLWPDPGEQYRTKGWIRTLDSLTVPFLGGLGPEQVRNLGYYDSTVQHLWQQRPSRVPAPLANLEAPGFFRKLNFDSELRHRPFVSNWPSLVNDLFSELERVEPEIVIAPHPYLDRHADHKFASIALFEALNRWDRETTVLLYTNHAVGNEAYPLGPRDGMTGLPAWDEDNLFITGIYSHLLDTEIQRRKLLAAEAMHDLRPFDPRDGSEIKTIDPDYDYFRRGPRPNELFLVTNLSGTRVIRTEFLHSIRQDELQTGM
jgi:LmbE family N-acetylglucosaminyl deacetylase